MKQIMALTQMKEMPQNCLECTNFACRLPLKMDGLTVKTAFVTKRHIKCPLKEVEINAMD